MDATTMGTTALSAHEARATDGGLTIRIPLGGDRWLIVELPDPF